MSALFRLLNLTDYFMPWLSGALKASFISEIQFPIIITHGLLFTHAVGDFSIVNFTDVTTESDLEKKTATFEFDFDPLIRMSPSLGYDGHLTWSQLDGQQSGNIAISSCPTRYPVIRQLERVGSTGTYRFSVPLLQLGQGRLSVNLTMSMTCNRYSYSCRCSGWKVRGTSAPLEISAKRG